MSQKRLRRRRPARRAAWRDPKPRILCVCEGLKTEPQYLKAFTRHCKNPRVSVEIDAGQGVPRTLVERAKQRKINAEEQAKRQRDDNLAFDQVWCVCDVDEHPKLHEARMMARDNGIELAISNPCFELWLILHFRESPGPQTRDQMTDILKKHLPDYDKSVDFAQVRNGYEEAVARASRLDKMAEEDGEMGRNPTTGAWRLTESIRGGTIN
ncbi:MAG: RloB domain-containing protein [Deltaproteobacteria bacterium]|nr:RloB domain-containing protein [Deltaproteobacteria bacterium]